MRYVDELLQLGMDINGITDAQGFTLLAQPKLRFVVTRSINPMAGEIFWNKQRFLIPEIEFLVAHGADVDTPLKPPLVDIWTYGLQFVQVDTFTPQDFHFPSLAQKDPNLAAALARGHEHFLQQQQRQKTQNEQSEAHGDDDDPS
eukprot:GABV01009247.1.p1 GENE.GABV01009247.1~~GABV01009247.1.p1  ORF type:complete len:145 (-),score=51.71 GABV01009247.1:35-469(-)